MKDKKFDNQYLCGFGAVSIVQGLVTQKDELEIKFPVIEIGYFNENKDRNVGQKLNAEDELTINVSRIIFCNLESLEVLQRAVDFCRKELESRLKD